MAEVIVTIYQLLSTLKGLYDTIEGNKEKCHNLINRCLSLKQPLEALQKNETRARSCQRALNQLVSVIEDCRDVCHKYKGKRWMIKAWRLALYNDQEIFNTLQTRLQSTVADLNLGVSVDNMDGVAQDLQGLKMSMGDEMEHLKENINDLKEMLYMVLKGGGKLNEFNNTITVQLRVKTVRPTAATG